jgi:hypothetical protein
MATITYEVPAIKGSPQLDRYGEWDGNTLLEAVLAADGQAVETFLAGFAIAQNHQFDEAERRADITTRTIEAVAGVIAGVSLTGFKAHANTDPKTRYRRPKLTNEGEGCESGYCDLAGKFRLPPAPEGLTYKAFTLACQKHAIEGIDARASLIAKGDEKYVYMTSDQHRLIKETVREALKAVTA